MKIYRMYPTSINERYLDEIAEILRQGGIVVYPTDTLYAIGCNALNTRAVARVCEIRDINPAKRPLSIVCSDISQASEYARIDNRAFGILRRNLPGPFTFILPASPHLTRTFKGRKEVGVRIPDNEIARNIAGRLGNPILSSTATWPGADPEELFHPEELQMHYSHLVDAFVDGGNAPDNATPSAIIDLSDSSEPIVVREGLLPLQ